MVSKASRNYTFTINERAALQVLSNALEYVAERPTEADRDAAMMLWAARQRILHAAGSRTLDFSGLYRQTLRVVWRNPLAGWQFRLTPESDSGHQVGNIVIGQRTEGIPSATLEGVGDTISQEEP